MAKKPSKDRQLFNSKSVYFGFFLIILLISLSIIIIQINRENSYVKLLYGHDWAHFAGSTVTNEGLRITPLNQVIIHQDGSKAQLNPPVNVRGPHLEFSGDFEIKASMDGVEDGASLQLYSQVPIIYDEWRHERPSLRVDISGKSVEMRVWDGNSSTPMDIRTYNAKIGDQTKINIKLQKGKITLIANGNTLGTMPDHNIFNNGTIWFGADGNDKGDGWLLRDLKSRPLGKAKLKVVDPPPLKVDQEDPRSLRTLAINLPRKIQVGTAVSANPLFTDARYQNIAMSQFDLITLESSLKAQFVHPAPNKYSFTDADNIIDMAEANSLAVHGHTLVFSKSNPSWMTDAPEADLEKIMAEHVASVVGHFKGRIASWDVVNEPLSEKDDDYVNGNLGLRQNFWIKAMGESYIDKAFVASKSTDPTAKLYINDYGIEHNGKRWDALVALLQRLKARGVPVDGVGFESHVYKTTDKIDLEVLRSHIKDLSAMGLSVRISEIDVTGTDPQFQSDQYSSVLSICVSEPNCTSFTTWGISDLFGSTTVSDRYPLLLGTSLLWDKDMKPKPVYSALQDVLNKNQVQR